MTRKPQFNQGLSPTDRKRETEKILVDYYGDDITRLTEGHTMQEARLTTGIHLCRLETLAALTEIFQLKEILT